MQYYVWGNAEGILTTASPHTAIHLWTQRHYTLDACCTKSQLVLIYHVHSSESAPNSPANFPGALNWAFLTSSNVIGKISKGQLLLWTRRASPEHSGLCCSDWSGQWWWMWCWGSGAALAGPGSTGGPRPEAAGTCSHQPKNRWVNFKQNRIIKKKTHAWAPYRMTHSGIFSVRCSICSIRDYTTTTRQIITEGMGNGKLQVYLWNYVAKIL